jgi:hypothetical protein
MILSQINCLKVLWRSNHLNEDHNLNVLDEYSSTVFNLFFARISK